MDYILALTAGILSFTSACILPLIPSYLAVITGLSVTELIDNRHHRKQILVRICMFIIGLIIPLILLGMTASTIGSKALSYSENFSKLFGFIVILFGLHLLGLLKFQVLNKEFRLDFLFKRKNSLWSVALMGLAFGFGWTPCIGPMLSSILIMAAESDTMWRGGRLLFVYGLGLGLPFLLIGILSTLGFQFLNTVKNHLRVISIISGIFLIILGLLLITGNMAYITPAL
ncbi:cytochrome c biogenesis protein CcdA (plasmid) [Anaerobacillus sp. CMMVII]|uniref:cytochrome c biogenesis CcdA family protein n=1 Tax=Anaerobacillus sp. CMMVII TaxID=2755588 RepID=UPI0021B7616C|nr:cytochrome c biogenesis CcdA family protein [Anaerobacillus sp. CMMVII]MCT8139233.1 cytochrome c biogenesis protein CcdA [Anaerobacillus sp. CMMVII]